MDTPVRDDKLLRGRGECCSVSWSAVIAGALVAFSLSALFHLLNAGLGLVAFPENFRNLSGVAIGGYIWLIICGIVAMFVAGWVAGKIGKLFTDRCYGILHGFLAWSLALLLTVFIAGHFMHSGAAAVANDRADTTHLLDTSRSDTEQAADVAGKTTLGIFFIFLLGAAAACAGGYVGARNGFDHRHSDHTHTPANRF